MRYAYCTQCDHVISYTDYADFPRTEWDVHQYFITTGYATREDAERDLATERINAKALPKVEAEVKAWLEQAPHTHIEPKK